MTITKALRKLYKVIVGEEAPANANTITKVLLALAEAWTGGGGEGGGSGGGGTAEPLIVRMNGGTLDKTWQEIYDAFPNVVIDSGNAGEGMYQQDAIENVSGFRNEYRVVLHNTTYKTTNASGYPKEDLH